jgi:porin
MIPHAAATAAFVVAGLLLPAHSAAACDEAAANCRGLTASVLYTGEEMRNQHGGIRTGSDYLDNLDLQLAADSGSIFGIPGLSGLIYILHNNQSTFSEDHVGDTQVVSNIDAPEAWRFYEVWLDWSPGADDRFSARFGLYDLNSEFDVSDTAGLFVGSSHGMNPTFSLSGLNGPSIFPVTGLALRLRGAVGQGGYWQAAVLDGVPGNPDNLATNEIKLRSDEGALLVAETGFSQDAWRKLVFGAWLYTADFDTLLGTGPDGEPKRGDGNGGFYAIADRELARGDFGQLSGYLRGGYASQRFNQVEYFAGGGLVLEQFWPGRAADQVGIAFASAINGDDFIEAQEQAGATLERHETVWELAYRAPVNDWLTLQPGVQYVVNPATEDDLDNALVFGLRFEVGWSRTF